MNLFLLINFTLMLLELVHGLKKKNKQFLWQSHSKTFLPISVEDYYNPL